MRLARMLMLLLVLLSAGLLCACDCGGDDDDESVDDDESDDDTADDDDSQADDDTADDDTGDDDTEDDDTSDDDTGDDDTADDDVVTEGTAWEDMREAEEEVADANFSTALVYYRLALGKLEDDDPANDGPVEADDADRCRYAQALMVLTLPLAIIDGFLGGYFDSEDFEQMMLDALGVDDPSGLATDLITVYLLEIILPLLDDTIADLDVVAANPDFAYRLPQIKIMVFGHAFRLPQDLSEEKGEHDLGERALLGAVYHLVRGVLRMLAANNIDTGAPNIDTWIYLLSSGDITVLFELMDEFPAFLTVHQPEDPPYIDGPALLAGSKADFTAALDAVTDDNDGDGYYWTDDNNTPLNPADDFVDPAESGDDLNDALRLETDDQTDDLLPWESGVLSFNVEMDGQAVASPLLSMLTMVLTHLPDAVIGDARRALAGRYPAEDEDADGFDNDIGMGTSTNLAATMLTDTTAAWTPGALVGYVLNPNADQADEYDLLRQFTIVANTATTITVEGDMTEIAESGDTYSIGDGVADDRPLDLSALIRLLEGNYVPEDGTFGAYPTAMFDTSVGLRYQLPLWDVDQVSPAFPPFVVDQTESYIDNNANGQWDPDVDTLVDAAHSYGGQNYPADGAYQPYYFFFPEATFGGVFTFGGGFAGADPTDALNRIISGLLVVLGKEVQP